jgi:hypothetical protein
MAECCSSVGELFLSLASHRAALADLMLTPRDREFVVEHVKRLCDQMRRRR